MDDDPTGGAGGGSGSGGAIIPIDGTASPSPGSAANGNGSGNGNGGDNGGGNGTNKSEADETKRIIVIVLGALAGVLLGLLFAFLAFSLYKRRKQKDGAPLAVAARRKSGKITKPRHGSILGATEEGGIDLVSLASLVKTASTPEGKKPAAATIVSLLASKSSKGGVTSTNLSSTSSKNKATFYKPENGATLNPLAALALSPSSSSSLTPLTPSVPRVASRKSTGATASHNSLNNFYRSQKGRVGAMPRLVPGVTAGVATLPQPSSASTTTEPRRGSVAAAFNDTLNKMLARFSQGSAGNAGDAKVEVASEGEGYDDGNDGDDGDDGDLADGGADKSPSPVGVVGVVDVAAGPLEDFKSSPRLSYIPSRPSIIGGGNDDGMVSSRFSRVSVAASGHLRTATFGDGHRSSAVFTESPFLQPVKLSRGATNTVGARAFAESASDRLREFGSEGDGSSEPSRWT